MVAGGGLAGNNGHGGMNMAEGVKSFHNVADDWDMAVFDEPTQQSEPQGRDRRSHGRIRCEEVTTQLGPVVDISASGIKAVCKGWRAPQIGEIVDLNLKHPQGNCQVKGEIVWLRRKGLRTYEVGLHFADTSEEARKGITEITRLALQSVSIHLSRSRWD